VPQGVTRGELEKIFDDYGSKKVEKKAKKEHAFVQFEDHEDADHALQRLQGYYISGQNLEIRFAEPKDRLEDQRKRLADEGERLAKENRAQSLSLTSKVKRLNLSPPKSSNKRSKK